MDPATAAGLGLGVAGVVLPLIDSLFRIYRSLKEAPGEFKELQHEIQSHLDTLAIIKERAERLWNLTGTRVRDWASKLLECRQTLESLQDSFNKFSSEQRKWNSKKRFEWVRGTLRTFAPRLQTVGGDLRMICGDYGVSLGTAATLQAYSESGKQTIHTVILMPVSVRDSEFAQLSNQSPAQIMDNIGQHFDLEQLIGLNGSFAPGSRSRAIMPRPVSGRIQELSEANDTSGGDSDNSKTGAAWQQDPSSQDSLVAKHTRALAELHPRLSSRWSVVVDSEPYPNGSYLVRFHDLYSGNRETLCPQEASTAPVGYRQRIWIYGDKLYRETVSAQ